MNQADAGTWNLVGYSSLITDTRFGDTGIIAADTACAAGCTPDEAAGAGIVANIIYRLGDDGSTFEMVDSTMTLDSWDGYWMYMYPGSSASAWILPLAPEPDDMPPGGEPAITDPVAGSTLAGSDVTFSWDANGASDIQQWYIRAGLSAGSEEFANVRITDPTARSYTVTGLPTDGKPVFLQFSHRSNGVWTINDVEYVAAGGGNQPNQPPVATDDTVGPVVIGNSLTFNVTGNDTDADGTIVPTSVVIVTGPTAGTAVVEADGQITYTHDGTADTESDSLTYTVMDEDGAVSAAATVSITPFTQPDPENQPPVAVDDTVGPVVIGESLTFNVTGNDTDSDGSIVATSVAIVSGPAAGTAVVASDGQITYTHDGTADTESDSLTYTVMDEDGAVSAAATVTITPFNQPDPENQPPVAVDDTVGPVVTGKSLTFNVTDNDLDSDGSIAATSVTIVSGPSAGAAVVEADGQITYTHDGSADTESDTLTYTVKDDADAVSNVATVTISPISEPENQAPVAVDDTVGPVALGSAITFDVAANDTDADGSVVATSVTIVTGPSAGTAVVEDDGQITYTNDGSAGVETDSLTYTVADDGDAVSNIATASITIAAPENASPVAVDDTVGPVIVGQSLTFSVVGNDTDADGSIVATSVTIVDGPSAGTAAIEADGQITYTHDGSSGTTSDSLTYTVEDDANAVSNLATVTITPIQEDSSGGSKIPAEVRQAVRLLNQGSFGASDEAINEVLTLGGPTAWVDTQLTLGPNRHLPRVKTLYPNDGEQQQRGRYQAFYDRSVNARDQLRQRVAFALSHIMVISDKNSVIGNLDYLTASYYDTLLENAFGNYRDLLEEVTLSPAMGIYLSMLGSRKPNEATGRRADENYAREVMQLFSIGLVGLNIDGTEREGTTTYTQEDVENLSRALTGWAWDLDRYRGYPYGFNDDRTSLERPMKAFQEHHDTDTKVFLGMDMPAGQTAEADLKMVLDRIFTHPNVGPFVGKQLIQRLVTSNPSPAYVARVATVFNDNGSGERGDLAAVVRAILLDPEATTESTDPTFGKLREPILRFAHMFRAFRASGQYTFSRSTESTVGQIAPLTAPSVFNFFSPKYSPPGALSNANVVAPEFQINSETNLNKVNRALMRNALDNKFHNADIALNLNTERGLLSDPDALLTHLDRILLGGRLSDQSRQIMTDYINQNKGQIDDDRILRDVVGLVLTSTEFSVQR
ncbi:MAG: DUF1800 family protein [Granulosicoccus sp.]|nr:DUF1800 family protein [Granulosicoccus sp.]